MTALSPGDTVAFGQGDTGQTFLKDGWSTPEPEFTWSNGPQSRVVLPLADSSVTTLRLEARSLVRETHPRQRLQIRINEVRVPNIVFEDGTPQQVDILLPRTVRKKLGKVMELDVEMRFPDAVSPQELGTGGDPRKLGVQIRTLTLSA